MNAKIKFFIILINFYLLTSCGFTPLHGVNNENHDVLAAIKVNKIDSEKPYLLRIHLENELNPTNKVAKKTIEINIKASKAIESLVIQADSTITRKNLVLIASFELQDIAKNKIFKKGTVKIISSFDEVSSPFASFQKEEKAFDDAAREAAKTIKAHVIIMLKNAKYI